MDKEEKENQLCAECNEDLCKTMNRQAEKLMYMLHELKHIGEYYNSVSDFYDAFVNIFPFFRDVEWYNPDEYIALSYLFDVVLVEKDEKPLR